jgi:hypothetical protein
MEYGSGLPITPPSNGFSRRFDTLGIFEIRVAEAAAALHLQDKSIHS